MTNADINSCKEQCFFYSFRILRHTTKSKVVKVWGTRWTDRSQWSSDSMTWLGSRSPGEATENLDCWARKDQSHKGSLTSLLCGKVNCLMLMTVGSFTTWSKILACLEFPLSHSTIIFNLKTLKHTEMSPRSTTWYEEGCFPVTQGIIQNKI